MEKLKKKSQIVTCEIILNFASKFKFEFLPSKIAILYILP